MVPLLLAPFGVGDGARKRVAIEGQGDLAALRCLERCGHLDDASTCVDVLGVGLLVKAALQSTL